MKEAQKHNVAYIAMGIILVPFFLWVKIPDKINPISVALYFALLTGFIGTALLLWQFALGTRTVSAKLFSDLSWAMKLHKNLGKYGTILIIMHPVLITYAYGEKLLYSVLPSFKSSFEWYVTWGRFSFMLMLIIWFTSALVRGNISYRPWKYVHYLSYGILPLVFIHSPPIGRSLSSSQILLAYWYTLAVIYLVLLALRLRHIFGFSKYRFAITANQQLTSNVWMLRLKPIERNIDIRKGQYVYLQRSLKGEEHPFSVLDYDHETGDILIAYKVFGSYTEKLTHMQPGQQMLMDGPYGVFTREREEDPARPAVFIAGGIGITPFVRHIMSSSNENMPYLFYANQAPESTVFGPHLKSKLGAKYVDIISSPEVQVPTNAERGHISTDIIQKHLDSPENYNYYLCGPRPMMETARMSLLNLGVSRDQIFSEEFNF